MNDLEITKLCAVAMGLWPDENYSNFTDFANDCYWPITDDYQSMQLVKKFTLRLDRTRGIPEKWGVYSRRDYGDMAQSDDLNRAICECVAKMQASKHEPA